LAKDRRQLAQDGVQFATVNYRNSHNKPFYMAPANRVDLLVRAPMQSGSAEVRVQNVMARSQVLPTPLTPGQPMPGTMLLTVQVAGPAVKRGGQDVQMPFLGRAPRLPKFLTDIDDAELRKSNFATKTLVFNSKPPQSPAQHTINDIQFEDGQARVDMKLNAVEEWTIQNTTNTTTGPPDLIDHPLHIHINPFQVTEVFDPNENLVDPNTGKLEAVVDATGKTVAVPKYVTVKTKVGPRQCFLDPTDRTTWKPCGPAPKSNLICGTSSRSRRRGYQSTQTVGRSLTPTGSRSLFLGTSRCAAASSTIQASMSCTATSSYTKTAA
jgi:Multicopper oxidase